ncbi:MAG: recombinase family protein [Pseudomonadaceae bacterium]|nr:recombinase family protein [Pseudomonadaceae bacterium]
MTAVIYLRVSTASQGDSGLGLEAQLAATQRFCQSHQLTPEAVHQDTASGADTDRPGLNQALVDAKRLRCPLVVSKLDRLSRDLAYCALLLKRAEVRVVDLNGTQDQLVLQIMAAVAERERELISQRTKAALAAKKARGERVGSSREFMMKIGKRGVKRQQEIRDAWALRNVKALEVVDGMSHRAAARQLNDLGVPAMKGGQWSHHTVKASRERLAGLPTAAE